MFTFFLMFVPTGKHSRTVAGWLCQRTCFSNVVSATSMCGQGLVYQPTWLQSLWLAWSIHFWTWSLHAFWIVSEVSLSPTPAQRASPRNVNIPHPTPSLPKPQKWHAEYWEYVTPKKRSFWKRVSLFKGLTLGSLLFGLVFNLDTSQSKCPSHTGEALCTHRLTASTATGAVGKDMRKMVEKIWTIQKACILGMLTTHTTVFQIFLVKTDLDFRTIQPWIWSSHPTWKFNLLWIHSDLIGHSSFKKNDWISQNYPLDYPWKGLKR